MNRDKALDFIYRHRDYRFYQPVIFVPGAIEISGKWPQDTRRMAELIFVDIAGKSVLDVGCNIGFFLREAKQRGASVVTGIDFDPGVIGMGQQISEILDDGIELLHEDLTTYIPTRHDYVLLLNILHAVDYPQEVVNKYLALTNDTLVMEHIPEHYEFFAEKKCHTIQSPRAFGHRQLTFISCKDI